jgi:hypothetical protein
LTGLLCSSPSLSATVTHDMTFFRCLADIPLDGVDWELGYSKNTHTLNCTLLRTSCSLGGLTAVNRMNDTKTPYTHIQEWHKSPSRHTTNNISCNLLLPSIPPCPSHPPRLPLSHVWWTVLFP